MKAQLKILHTLDGVMKKGSVRAVIDSIIPHVERKLETNHTASLTWEPVPLDTYADGLPEIIGSSWIFVIRAQTNSGSERHPNSHQYMMSYRGSGDLQVKAGEEWISNHLVSEPNAEARNRWISIPPNNWHRVVTSKENWIVVSFHTVPEDELIEERPDPSDTRLTRQKFYLDE